MSDATADARDVAEFRADLLDQFPEALGSVERRIEIAATRLKMTFSAVKRIWYGEATLIRAHQKARMQQIKLEEARRAHRQFVEKTARLAELLERQDEGFHSPDIRALREFVERQTSVEGAKASRMGAEIQRLDRAGNHEGE